MELKILSWNIWYDGDSEKVNEFLENFGADIIGLQEVRRIDGRVQLSKRLTFELAYEYVYYPVFNIEKNGQTVEVGNAIVSKYPIVKSVVHNLSKEENRLAIEAEISVDGKTFHIFCTHLFHTHQKPSEIQDEQEENLIKVLPRENTILMGDFNALPDSNVVKRVSEVMINADSQLLPTWSIYPEGCEVCKPEGVAYKLDNIFLSRDLKTNSFEVESSKASDHLPISAIVEI